MGVLSNLGGVARAGLQVGKAAAKDAVKKNVTKSNVKKFALSAGSRLVKTAWDWSGASEVAALDGGVKGAGKFFDFLRDQRDSDGDGMDDETGLPMRSTPRLSNNSAARNNRSQGLTPRPLALPAPARPSNQETRAARQVTAETREKQRTASKANAAQRNQTRQANLAAMKGRAEAGETSGILRNQLQVEEKSAAIQVKIYDELEAIHGLMLRDNNPLLRKEGAGRSLTSRLAGAAASRIPGLGGLIGSAAGGVAGGALGGKVLGKAGGLLGKAGGLVAKIPGGKMLGKLAGFAIPGLAGLAGMGAGGGFAAGAEGAGLAGKAADVVDGAPKAAGKGLAGKVGDVTDVVAKGSGKSTGKGIAKGLGKSFLKKIPLIGALAGIGFGISRAAKGDWSGAGLEVASGLASTVPGFGTAASIGIDAALIGKDAMAEDEAAKKLVPEEEKQAVDKTGKPMVNAEGKPVDKTGAVVASGKLLTTNPDVTQPLAPLAPPPVSDGVERRNPVMAAPRPESGETARAPVTPPTAPLSRDTASNPGALAASLASPPIASSGASASWREGRKSEESVRMVDLLTTLSTAMLDRDKGIFVKPGKDPFGSGDDLFIGTAAPSVPGAKGEAGEAGDAGVVVKPAAGAAPNLEPVPTAKASQVKVAPIGGSGFIPNAERPQSPRPYLGGGVVPAAREDVSKGSGSGVMPPAPAAPPRLAAPKDASVAIKPPAAPVVGVKGAGKGFKGFGDETDGHIKEASAKYGIGEDVLRGFVKMEGGWNGAMSPTGAIGTGQFIQPTWDGLAKTKEGKEIGMEKIGSRFRKDDDPRRDKKTNTMATGLLASENAKMLKANGLEATGENLYMMHNIGPGVMDAMKGKKVGPATLKAMQQNGMKDGMTGKDFVDYQKSRYNSHYAQANAPEVIAAAKNSGVTTSPVATADAKAVSKDSGQTVASVARPANTETTKNAMTLAASQRDANAAKAAPSIIVAGGGGGEQRAPKQSSAAAGDGKPPVVVRNNESSLSRVTDSLIARTIT